jgi:hypothetical protein
MKLITMGNMALAHIDTSRNIQFNKSTPLQRKTFVFIVLYKIKVLGFFGNRAPEASTLIILPLKVVTQKLEPTRFDRSTNWQSRAR